jgi:hypothetical protein
VYYARPPAYFSQWGSLEASYFRVVRHDDVSRYSNWRQQGFDSAQDYRRWGDNSCGVSCVQSVLHSARLPIPPKATLISELTEAGAYVVADDGHIAGLIYDPCVRWLFDRWAIKAETVRELSVSEISECVTGGGLAIASVSSEIRFPYSAPSRRGGHLVLVFASDGEAFTLHNPSGLAARHAPDQVESAQAAVVPIPLFERFFSHRGILFR